MSAEHAGTLRAALHPTRRGRDVRSNRSTRRKTSAPASPTRASSPNSREQRTAPAASNPSGTRPGTGIDESAISSSMFRKQPSRLRPAVEGLMEFGHGSGAGSLGERARSAHNRSPKARQWPPRPPSPDHGVWRVRPSRSLSPYPFRGFPRFPSLSQTSRHAETSGSASAAHGAVMACPTMSVGRAFAPRLPRHGAPDVPSTTLQRMALVSSRGECGAT